MKIDAYAHIIPPKVKEAVLDAEGAALKDQQDRVRPYPSLYDLDERFRIMDKHPDRVEVLTLGGFSVDEVTKKPQETIELSQRINEEMAELVYKYPDRFVAATAVLPLSDMDASLMELDRAIKELNLRGMLIRIPINGKPADSPEFMPLYERMSYYNLPIWFHPSRSRKIADYPIENESKYDIYHMWGLPYETTATMARLVFSGVMQKYPNLKIITHHCGAMIPYFARRTINHYNIDEMRIKRKFTQGLTEPLIEYFRRFYNDTALVDTPALMCAYQFFGAEHLLFAHDMPFDIQTGEYGIRNAIEAIEQMDIPDSDKKKIFEDNARNIMRLAV